MSNGGMAADLDGDGALELVGVTTDSSKTPPVSYVNLWSIPGSKPRSSDWPVYARDPRHSGCQGSCASKSSTPWRADAGSPRDAALPDSRPRDLAAREAPGGEPPGGVRPGTVAAARSTARHRRSSCRCC